MAIRTGTWQDGNILNAADLNDSIGAIMKGPAEQANKILKASGTYENGGATASENYTVAEGINGTVNIFNPNSPYVIVEADSIPTVNINNCESLTLSAGRFLIFCTDGTDEEKRAKIYKTLFYGTGTGNNGLAKDIVNCTAIKTNVSRDVGKRAYYGFSSVGDFANSSSGNYVRLDGSFASTTGNESVSSWSYCIGRNDGRGEWEIATNTVRNFAQSSNSTIVTSDETGFDLTGDEIDNPATCRFEARAIDSAADYGRVYGFILTSQAITFTETETVSSSASFSTGSTDFLTDEGIPAFTVAEVVSGTNAIFATDKYIISGPTGNTDTSNETGSIVSDSDYTTTGTINSGGFFSSIRQYLVNSGTSSQRRVTISKNGTQVAQKTYTGGGDIYNHTFEFSDYSEIFETGDTFSIRYEVPVSGGGTAQKNTNVSHTGDLFSYNSQEVSRNQVTVFTQFLSNTSGTISCNTNTITLDGTEKAICVYSDQTTPTNTNITVDVSDGTTTLSGQAITNGFSDLIDISSLSSGTLELTFNLNTTDTSLTPTQSGWGVYVI